ncbi:hypothetical protein KL86PLE_40712 [uncultured Pleomorphomonas sp.]|uniref:Uncharacterized protein n=1 Tax=uncultured Pleomorphomonas sp. TaxID=442121 RepID=A0A212LHF5_9HYPH|nr:hypothetical protein KL86PLE_40712 [uncultured Pleomorphomonas sp.]
MASKMEVPMAPKTELTMASFPYRAARVAGYWDAMIRIPL